MHNGLMVLPGPGHSSMDKTTVAHEQIVLRVFLHDSTTLNYKFRVSVFCPMFVTHIKPSLDFDMGWTEEFQEIKGKSSFRVLLVCILGYFNKSL